RQESRLQRESRGHLAQQNGNCVFQLCPLQAYRRKLRARVLAQRVSLVNIGRRRDAFLIAVARQHISPVVDLDGIHEKLYGRVIPTQRKIIGRQLGLQGQLHEREVRGARLRLGFRRRRGIAQSAEKIDFPVQVQTRDEVISGYAAATQRARQWRVG